MALRVTVDVSKQTAEGVWYALLTPDEVKVLGRAECQFGSRSILGIPSFELSKANGISLTFAASDAKVFNIGTSNECLIVDLRDSARNDPTSLGDDNVDLPIAEVLSDHADKGAGDAGFLKACKEEGLPSSMVSLASDFLSSVREFADDPLHEGLNRKWVTKPRNFLAVTIQNRNKQFRVHVKKSAALIGLKDILDIRDDRPGYSRFWLQNREQLGAAVTAARHSLFT